MTTPPEPDDPQDREADRLLDHEYDGIHEYDNPLPRWWTTLFWATIVFSALYLLNLPGIGVGRGRLADYERDMAAARERQAARAAQSPPPAALSDDALTAMAKDPARLTLGREQFVTTCAACHREDGGGSIGPNLTDAFWIHGGRPTEILKTVTDGVLDKGMPAWGQTLSPDEVAAVAAYVLTLHDTHPPNPKEPQGTRVEREAEDH